MHKNRRLRLNRETVRKLSPDEMQRAAGGRFRTQYCTTLWLCTASCDSCFCTIDTCDCPGNNPTIYPHFCIP